MDQNTNNDGQQNPAAPQGDTAAPQGNTAAPVQPEQNPAA